MTLGASAHSLPGAAREQSLASRVRAATSVAGAPGSASAAGAGVQRASRSGSASSTGAFSVLPPPSARIRQRCPETPCPAPLPAPLRCNFGGRVSPAFCPPWKFAALATKLGHLGIKFCPNVQFPSVRGSWYLTSWWDPRTWAFSSHHTPGEKKTPTKLSSSR